MYTPYLAPDKNEKMFSWYPTANRGGEVIVWYPRSVMGVYLFCGVSGTTAARSMAYAGTEEFL